MIIFTGNPLDRAADKRDDAAWLAEQRATAKVIAFHEGKPLLRRERLAHIESSDENAIFLGVDESDTAFFVVESDDALDGEFRELRAVALTLPAEEAAIVATAKCLFEWHGRHRFCSNCGHATDVVSAGWKRVCPACKVEHFPRVDPVVIMLPTRNGMCLLGRQAIWPKGRMAPLAGFVEPGESIEEACAREVKEEAGLRAVRVGYHASQPWPFPSSLMFGLFVEVEGEAVPDGVEIEELRWLSRDDVRAILAGKHPDILAPNGYAIGHELLAAWVKGDAR